MKAILFYLGLLPLFVDLAALIPVDILTILLITVITVGGDKLCYVIMATKIATALAGHHYVVVARKATAILLFGAGVYLLIMTLFLPSRFTN